MHANSHEPVDPVIDLYVAVVKRAVDDYKRGPCAHVRRQREYESARSFLERCDLLQYVQQRDADDEVLIDDLM